MKMKRKPQITPSAELQNAHAELLSVTAREGFFALNGKLGAATNAIETGQLKPAYDTLTELITIANRMKREIEHSARQLGVNLGDDDDDDDDDDE